MRVLSITVLLVRLLLLFLGLFLSELLDQEPTLLSGMLRVNEITFFVFFGVDMARQIQHVIPILIFYFLGVSRPFGLPLELSLNHSQGFTRSSWRVLALLFLTGVSSSGFVGDYFVLATPESVFLFAVSVFGGNLHHPSQSHISCPTKFQIQFPIFNAFFEGTNCLVA